MFRSHLDPKASCLTEFSFNSARTNSCVGSCRACFAFSLKVSVNIHPWQGQQPKQGSQGGHFPLPSYFIQLFWGIQRRSPANQDMVSPVCLGFSRGLLPEGCAPNERRLEVILSRCPSHLIWLFSRSSSSILYSALSSPQQICSESASWQQPPPPLGPSL